MVASLLMRLASYPVSTSDYVYFLSKWFSALQSTPGLTAFAHPFADYAPLYLYLLKGLTYLPFPALYSIKTLSFFFDEVLAALVCLIVRLVRGPSSWPRLFLSFAVVMAVPTIIINSTLWGQSDSIYAAFVLASLACVLMDAPAAAALLFSVAFAFKFQAIFFLPVLLGYLLRRQETLVYALLIPLLYAATIIPAWMYGGDFSYWFFVYGTETTEYSALTSSAPSVFAFFGGLPLPGAAMQALFWAGLGLTGVLALAFILIAARAALSSPRRVLLLSLLCVLSLAFFLPRMHERYFYLADALSLTYALVEPKKWYLPTLVAGASLLSYMPYLSQLPYFAPFNFDLRLPAAMLAAALCLIVWFLWQEPEVAPVTEIIGA